MIIPMKSPVYSKSRVEFPSSTSSNPHEKFLWDQDFLKI